MILNLNPVIAPCSKSCRSRIALLPSSVVAISWQWAHFVLLMKWACASRRMFRLIGYDNVRNARYFTPALTTIHQPKDSLGETAFNMLLDRIVNKREEPQSIEVHPRLIERRSVADGPFRDYRR